MGDHKHPRPEELNGRGELQTDGRSYEVAFSFSSVRPGSSGHAAQQQLAPEHKNALFVGRIKAKSEAALMEIVFSSTPVVLTIQDGRRLVLDVKPTGIAVVLEIETNA